MFIFYGWGKKTIKTYETKREGRCKVSVNGTCDHLCRICQNDTYHYQRVITWFTLFFIPIIPYSFKYYKVCARCQNALDLGKKDFFAELNDTAVLNQAEIADPFSLNSPVGSSNDSTLNNVSNG